MTYALAITAVLLAVVFVALYTPRDKRPRRQEIREFEPGETLESLTADLETVMAEAVRELDICQPYIMPDSWKDLEVSQQRERRQARRRYILALEAWRKAEECLNFDGKNGNIDLRMIGSIPLVRKAGIYKARQSIQESRDLQNSLGLNS